MSVNNSPEDQNRPRLLPGESGVPTQKADELQRNLDAARANQAPVASPEKKSKQSKSQRIGPDGLPIPKEESDLSEEFMLKEPSNIMEVAQKIMEGASKPEFREGGKYALLQDRKVGDLDVQQTDGTVKKEPVYIREYHPENFVRWHRERIIFQREDNSPNAPAPMWTDIKINMGFRQYSFLSLIDTISAWRIYEAKEDKNGPYGLKFKDGVVKTRTVEVGGKQKIYVDNVDRKEKFLESHRDNLTWTMTRSNFMHRNETTIRKDAGGEDTFSKAFYAAFENNDLTKNSMGGGYGGMFFENEASAEETQKRIEGDKSRGKAGQGAQIATLLYYYLQYVDKDPNHYMFSKWKETNLNEKGTGYVVLENGIRIDVVEEILKRDLKDDERSAKNIFEEVLNADVELEMGRTTDKTIHVDGVNEFYSSMAQNVLKGQLDTLIEKASGSEKEELTHLKEIIARADDAGINWLNKVDQLKKDTYMKRILFQNREKYDEQDKQDELWNGLINISDTVKTNILEKLTKNTETELQNTPDMSDTVKKTKQELIGMLQSFSSDQDGQTRKKFTVGLLTGIGTISGHKDLNLFDRPHKSKEITDIVRKAVRDVIRTKTNMDDAEDARWSEFNAQMLWDPFMMYGVNDTGYVGFRGYSKVMNLRGYRRKSVDNRSEKNGNLFDIDDIKGLLLDPLRAWKVSKEGVEDYTKSFLEVVQGGVGDTVKLNKMGRFVFKVGTEKQYAGDPVTNSVKVYKALADPHAIDFLKDLSWGPNGDIQRGSGWQAMMELLHDIRYSLDRDYPYDTKALEWNQDQDGNIKISTKDTRQIMFSDAVIGLNMYNPKSLNLDEDMPEDKRHRFKEKDQAEKMGRNLFFFIMQRWILARRISSSGLPPISRAEIELIRTAYKTFPTNWKNKNGRQVPVDYMLMAEEWNRIENGFKYEGKKYEGYHTKQTRGVDFVERRAVQGVGNFVGQSFVAVRDLAKLLLKTDWH